MKIRKYLLIVNLVLLTSLIIGFVLRFWRINDLVLFNWDYGWYYLSAKDMLTTGEIPLVGIPSSVPVFKQGALFTWLLAGSLLLGNFNPVSGVILVASINLISVFGVYKILKNWFGKRVGVIGSLLAATSPFIVVHSRMPYHTSLIFPTTLLIAWSAYKAARGQKVHFFLLGLWLSFLYQFELAGIILVPIVILAFIWKRIYPNTKNLLRFIAGGLLGLTPFIIHDLKEGVYLQTLGFVGWVFVKVKESVFGLFTGQQVGVTIDPVVQYITRIIYVPSVAITLLILISSLVFYFYLMKKKGNRFERRLIFLWITIVPIAILTRGIVSEAYLPLLILPILIVISFLLGWIVERLRGLGWLLVFSVSFLNTLFLFQNDFLAGLYYNPSLGRVKKVSDFIIDKTKGEDYELTYKGPAHVFEAGDNHYRYILWWKGNEPKDTAETTYYIFQPRVWYDKYDFIKFDEVYDLDFAIIGKKND